MPSRNEITAFWDRRPCEAWHGTSEFGSPSWSFEIKKQRYKVQPHILKFADFPKWRGKKVLEIGCGIGTDLLMFSHYGAEVWGVDDSYKSVDLALERFLPYRDFAKYHILTENAEEWLPQDKFDLIYSFGVLHHTLNPESVLANARVRMADDGELRIMLYAKWSIKHLFGFQPEAQAGCPLVKWYSGWEARKLLWSCGFDVMSIHKTHIFPWRIKEYVQHKYVKALPWRWMPKWLFAFCERMGGHHLLIVARKACNDR